MRKLTAHSIEVTSTHPWQTSPSGVLYVSMFFSSDKQPEARVAARFVFIGTWFDGHLHLQNVGPAACTTRELAELAGTQSPIQLDRVLMNLAEVKEACTEHVKSRLVITPKRPPKKGSGLPKDCAIR